MSNRRRGTGHVQDVPDYKFYRDRLDDPSLIDRAIITESGDLAVPAGGKRYGGYVAAETRAEAFRLIRQMEARPAEFPDVRLYGGDRWIVEWGPELDWRGDDEGHPEDYVAAGCLFGYSVVAIAAYDRRAKAGGGKERWLPIPGYEGLYLVSNHGQIESLPRTTTRGGILKHIIDKRGYHHVTLTRNGKQKHFAVHQLVMLAFTGAPEDGHEIRHLDGDLANNYWEPGTEEETRAIGGNLLYGSHAENMADMTAHGTGLATARETHCPKGHEYTPENTRSRKRGGFVCVQCCKDYQREYQREYRRKRLEDPAFRDRINASQRRNYRKRKDNAA